MKAGETLWTDDNKYQVCLFPLEVMNITQLSGPGSLSHCCGHPFDCVGTTSRYPIYAPVDCHLIYSDSVGNTRGYQSDKQVQTPTGVSYVCFSFTHDANPPTKTTFKQGELIAHTGIAGQVTGDHTHIDQAKGQNKQLVDYGVVCKYGNECYALQDSAEPVTIWYDNDTQIINTMGLKFETYKGGHPEPPVGTGRQMPFIYYLKRRVR